MSDDRPARRTLLSPHLDDLALSCFGALRPGDTALTVFTADPSADGLLSDWDAQSGAASSKELMATRRAEDRAAMALAGATVRHLPFGEQHHRAGADVAAPLAAALADELADATEVWVPAAVFGNPDHALVRSVAFSVLAKLSVSSVWLYAEYPYHQYLSPVSADGPAPGSGSVRASTVPALADWFRQRVHAGAPDARANPTVRVLDDAELALKQQAVQCYRSQIAPLDRTLGGRLLESELLRDEYAWQVRGVPATKAAR
jgi:LmbE family N-acetylglucosaminyl deacetylase